MNSWLLPDIIRPSLLFFFSLNTIAPKGDGTFRHCTFHRAVNRETSLIPFPMLHIDTIIDVTGGWRFIQDFTSAKDFGS